jgi:glycine/D-amino acid oxidase-like deaminating enzyme
MNLWDATLENKSVERESLKKTEEVDVAIIGAGFTGLWSAYHLLSNNPDLKIAIIEKEHVGFGASGRNGGWVSALYPSEIGTDVVTPHLMQSIDEIGIFASKYAPDANFRKGGTVTFARNKGQLKRLKNGIGSATFLNQSETLSKVQLNGALGSLFTPDCATIHPGRFVRALANHVEQLGARIYEKSPALRNTDHKVSTPSGALIANSVISATEAFAKRSRERVPLYSLMVATEPLNEEIWGQIGLANGESFAEASHLVTYGQRTGDNRLAVGGRGAPYLFGSLMRSAAENNSRIHDQIIAMVREWFPPLVNTKFTHRWGGAVSVTRDWQPFANFNQDTGQAKAGGYVGDGVTLSYLAAKTLADLILEKDSELTKLPFVNHTPPLWEPEPLRWLGVNSVVKLIGLADREEAATNQPSLIAKALSKVTGN